MNACSIYFQINQSFENLPNEINDTINNAISGHLILNYFRNK